MQAQAHRRAALSARSPGNPAEAGVRVSVDASAVSESPATRRRSALDQRLGAACRVLAPAAAARLN
jgi:hypothetical protein